MQLLIKLHKFHHKAKNGTETVYNNLIMGKAKLLIDYNKHMEKLVIFPHTCLFAFLKSP